jgi:prepilin-type N-terminal cleavage/methylation domain-containing protein
MKGVLIMRSRKGFTLIELMIVIAIIGILAAIAIPNFRKARQQARQKACFANQRVIMGAIEMYNMDTNAMMDSYGDAEETSLINGKYLKSKIVPAEANCAITGSNLIKEGIVECSVHGSPENPKNLDGA